jgi:hypothetical protein
MMIRPITMLITTFLIISCNSFQSNGTNATQQDRNLVEFSSSFDFSEYEEFLEYIKANDETLYLEIVSSFDSFKKNNLVTKYYLGKSGGYVEYNLDDVETIEFFIYSTKDKITILEKAYTKYSEDAGI